MRSASMKTLQSHLYASQHWTASVSFNLWGRSLFCWSFSWLWKNTILIHIRKKDKKIQNARSFFHKSLFDAWHRNSGKSLFQLDQGEPPTGDSTFIFKEGKKKGGGKAARNFIFVIRWGKLFCDLWIPLSSWREDKKSFWRYFKTSLFL